MKSVDFSSKEGKSLFSVADRSVITKALTDPYGLNRWDGTRKGFLVELAYHKDWAIGAQICWGVCIKRHWKKGTSCLISEAMQLIEQKVANRDWDARKDSKE
jgi:hypothetical protein